MLRKGFCVLALLAPLPAMAVTGADLLKLCKKTDVTSQTACAAYIAGAADGEYNTIEAIGGTSGPKVGQYFCLPPGVTSREITQAVKEYMRQNPDRLQYNGSSVVALGLGAAFPCKE